MNQDEMFASLDRWPAKQAIQVIDAHTAGEPLRIITGGFPETEGKDVLARRRFVRDNYDHLRKVLMLEPRGHADMYGCLIVPPNTKESDFGVIFLHNEGYSSMCGHGIVAVTKVAIQTGLIPVVTPKTTINIDSPAGKIIATAHVEKEVVTSVEFENVASYVVALDQTIQVDGFGQIKYDLAFGGAYYAYVSIEQFDFGLTPEDSQRLIRTGKAIKQAIMDSIEIRHPHEPDLSFLYGTIFVGPPLDKNHHSRNVCIFADGQVDRSPTGTGVSGRAAIEFARRNIKAHQSITIESILGTTFDVCVVNEAKIGDYSAILPRVSGNAFITGRSTFYLDANDPMDQGFLIR